MDERLNRRCNSRRTWIYVRPAVASRQGGLIFKMSPGLFRFLTKGLLVRQANVWTAGLIVARLPAVLQQKLCTHTVWLQYI